MPEQLRGWALARLAADAPFTTRQAETLGLLREQLPKHVIAERLGVGVSTIRNHVDAIRRRSGAASIAAVLRHLDRMAATRFLPRDERPDHTRLA